MRVAIDLSQIVYGTGVSHYRVNLIKNLLKIDNENEYVLYGGALRQFDKLKNLIEGIAEGYSNTDKKLYYVPPRLADVVWNKLHILPIEKLIGECDLIHTSDWAEPPSRINKVTTIHDLVPLIFSKVTPKVIVDTHKRRLKWVESESKKIIVPSIATKEDLVKIGFNENKISVVYEAPNHRKASKSEIDRVLSKYKIREDYIISVGVNPRKNIERSIEAFNLAKSGKNLKYVIVGPESGVKYSDQRGVRFLGFVPDEDLEGLISGAKAEIFASLYEGFGIPILDAYSCEVPVVTSNISSMPEAAGGAAVLVDPYNVNSIADGIEEALSKPKTLIAKGLKVASNYSWQKNAEETLKVYNNVHEK